MKHILFIFFLFSSLQSFSQTDSLIDSSRKSLPAKDSLSIQTPINSLNDSLQQSSDSALAKDSTIDSSVKNISQNISHFIKHLNWQHDTLFTHFFKVNFLKKRNEVELVEQLHTTDSKDVLFYSLAGIFLFTGFIRVSFRKYFNNIFRLFFQNSFRQKQKREVVLQDNLPSLLTNILFFLSAGMFVTLINSRHNFFDTSVFLLFLYSTSVLAFVYLFKFVFINFCGWVFKAREASDSYISIVFLVNKLTGILLLPLLLLLAFAGSAAAETVITIAAAIVILLLIYRYIMIVYLLQKSYRINPFHFFIYLCGVEIIPLLVIYKILFTRF